MTNIEITVRVKSGLDIMVNQALWIHGICEWELCVYDSTEIEINTFLHIALCTIGKI